MCRAARPLLRAASARQHPAAAAGPMRRGGRAAGRGLFTSRSGAESRSRPPGGTRRRRQILSTMARRPRSSTAWHFVLSAARRDVDARAVALAGSANWGYDSDGQHSDSDSDPESSALPPPIPSAVPVTGESFCDCDSPSEASFCNSLHAAHRGKDCRCGEEDEYFDWVWDDLNKSSATLLSCDNRKVNFHTEYSCGTAAIRGTKELGEGQHFWEIKMTSPVYGTDMMVGIGTSDVDLDKYHHTFCSLLGRDEDSWGLSYTGLLHHKGDKMSFSSRFGQGSIIGVHLDTWHGTLTFFKNRKCIGEGGWARAPGAGSWSPRPSTPGSPRGCPHRSLRRRDPRRESRQGCPCPRMPSGDTQPPQGARAQAMLPAPAGVAATKLQNKKFYPMVCSTAAKSSMKVIRSCASVTSLQFLCCYRLRQLRPDSGDTLEGLPLPPGLKQVLRHKLGWVLSMSCGRHKPPAPSPKAMADPGGPETRRCQRKRCRRT
ncbi:SPRY domain-containing SOCS box protein 3 isoform X1 [Lynx canadensis]|uniref:SPRY domain-containing SOCS box protein 3 isoform X1 n=1 Tax=Lynx canadensis TaxID=61383 RepID=UPI0011B0A86E|nr:SPRY domain-containing SOCS box protein 3 isoform X1 [Lynx canadensis]